MEHIGWDTCREQLTAQCTPTKLFIVIHLSDESHRNAKAEGLVKLLLSFETVAFMLLLKVKSLHYLYSLPDLVGTVWEQHIYLCVYFRNSCLICVVFPNGYIKQVLHCVIFFRHFYPWFDIRLLYLPVTDMAESNQKYLLQPTVSVSQLNEMDPKSQHSKTVEPPASYLMQAERSISSYPITNYSTNSEKKSVRDF